MITRIASVLIFLAVLFGGIFLFSPEAVGRTAQDKNEIIIAVYSTDQFCRDEMKRILSEMGYTVITFEMDSLDQMDQILEMFHDPNYNLATAFKIGNRLIPSYLVMIRPNYYQTNKNYNANFSGFGINVPTTTVHVDMNIDFIIVPNGESYSWTTSGEDTEASLGGVNTQYGNVNGTQPKYNTTGAVKDALSQDDIKEKINQIPDIIESNYYPGHIPHPEQAYPANPWPEDSNYNGNYSYTNNNYNYQTPQTTQPIPLSQETKKYVSPGFIDFSSLEGETIFYIKKDQKVTIKINSGSNLLFESSLPIKSIGGNSVLLEDITLPFDLNLKSSLFYEAGSAEVKFRITVDNTAKVVKCILIE
ncbi:MAG: hypothetical protein WC570_01830 [Patescibacteria group bacterium]